MTISNIKIDVFCTVLLLLLIWRAWHKLKLYITQVLLSYSTCRKDKLVEFEPNITQMDKFNGHPFKEERKKNDHRFLPLKVAHRSWKDLNLRREGDCTIILFY